MTSFQSLAARPHSAVMFRRASQINFVAASSLGKWPRDLMILRSLALMLSMALSMGSSSRWVPLGQLAD